MKLFDLKYYFFKFDYIKYLLLFLGIHWFLQRFFTAEIQLNTILRLIILGIIMYFIFIFDYKKKKDLGDDFEKKIKLVKTPNIHHIYKDTNGVLFYSKMIEYRKVNKYAYQKSMTHYDNFINMKNHLINGVNFPKNYYDILENEMEKCINSFASIGLTNKVDIKKLDFYVKKLYNILQQHKNEVIDTLKKKWRKRKDTGSFYIDNSSVKPDNTNSPEYSQHYSLF